MSSAQPVAMHLQCTPVQGNISISSPPFHFTSFIDIDAETEKEFLLLLFVCSLESYPDLWTPRNSIRCLDDSNELVYA